MYTYMLVVSDWDAVEQVWRHAFSGVMRVDTKEHPMMIADPAFNTADR